jgi:hypothetical protein
MVISLLVLLDTKVALFDHGIRTLHYSYRKLACIFKIH